MSWNRYRLGPSRSTSVVNYILLRGRLNVQSGQRQAVWCSFIFECWRLSSKEKEDERNCFSSSSAQALPNDKAPIFQSPNHSGQIYLYVFFNVLMNLSERSSLISFRNTKHRFKVYPLFIDSNKQNQKKQRFKMQNNNNSTQRETWTPSLLNIAGQSINVVSPVTLDAMYLDMVLKNVVSTNPSTCWICTLSRDSGGRQRKCVPQNRFASEYNFWKDRDNDMRSVSASAYWKDILDPSNKRKNHSVLAYHLSCWKRNKYPDPNTNASHICGNCSCVNPEHLRWETMQYNATRNYRHYFGTNEHCLHSPRCVIPKNNK